jgi:hypothetical protein
MKVIVCFRLINEIMFMSVVAMLKSVPGCPCPADAPLVAEQEKIEDDHGDEPER